MSVGDKFTFYAYNGDDGQVYGVKLSDAVATAGGFTSLTLSSATRLWPYHYRDLRHVTGTAGTPGKHGRLPIASNTNSLYQTGGTWTLHGTTYGVQGAEGERRPATHLR